MKSLQLTPFRIPRLSGPQTSPKQAIARQSEPQQGKASHSEAKRGKAKTKRAKAKQNSPWRSTAAESKGKRSAHTSRAVMEHGPAQKWLSETKRATVSHSEP